MARQHDRFEWDPTKAQANSQKHGLSFVDAARVLADDDGDRFQLDVSQLRGGEARYKTYASDPANRAIVYIIVWAPRSNTRIISARFATPKERKFHADNI